MVSSRRAFIGAAAGTIAAAATGTICRPAAALALRRTEVGGPTVLAVTAFEEGLVGLVRSGEGGPATVVRMVVGEDGTLAVTQPVGAPLPADIVPVALATGPGGLLIGGSRARVVERVPTPVQFDVEASGERLVDVYGVSAVILRVGDPAHAEIALPPALAGAPYSTVEALSTLSDGTVLALVGHNRGDPEAHYAGRLTVLTLADGSVANRVEIARDLGESGPNFLTDDAVAGPVQAVVNQPDGRHLRLATDRRAGGAQDAERVRTGRVRAAFGRGDLVEDPVTGELRWESASGVPASPELADLLARSGGSVQVVPIAGDPDRAVALAGGRVTIVPLGHG